MTGGLKRLTAFAHSNLHSHPEVWINPAQVAYVEPRIVYRGQAEGGNSAVTDGTVIYFQQEAGTLAVRESVAVVVALLNSTGGVCRSCHQELPNAWQTLCDDCRRDQFGLGGDK